MRRVSAYHNPFKYVASRRRSAEAKISTTPRATEGEATPSLGRITRITPTIRRIRPIHHVTFFGAESLIFFIRYLLLDTLYYNSRPYGA
jgi:hypothetical protein